MKFIEKMNELYKENKELNIFLDMDGTVVEYIFDLEESFAQEGGYVKKQPIRPVIEKINEIKNTFPDAKIKILSCSRNHRMTKEKNEWLDKNIPYIQKENRIFLEKEDNKYEDEDRSKVKGEYLKNNIN